MTIESRLIDAKALSDKIHEYMRDYSNATARLTACRAILRMLGDKNQTPTMLSFHIDREKWEPCKCCREPIGAEPYAKEKYPEICDFEVILDGGDEITVNAYNHYTPVTEEVCFSFPVSFCPKCGRPLTEQAWAEMEKRMRW